MKKRPLLLLVAAMSVAAGAGFAVTYLQRPSRPVVVAPDKLDLGVQSARDSVHVPFAVYNAGESPLQLNGFRSNCGCLTVTALRDGGYVPVDEVTIPPGEQVTLRSGLVALGKPGDKPRVWLQFTTNDPDRPEVTVEFTAELQGSVVAAPSELALGNLQPGEVVTRQLQVRDLGRKAPFVLHAVRSNVPGIIAVVRTKQSPGATDGTGAKLAGVVSAHTAELKVTAPSQPGPIHGRLDVFEENNPMPVLQVPVTGRVVPRFEMSPNSVVLPRRSASGLLYAAKCFCTSTSGKPFTLTLLSAPPGITTAVKKMTESRYLIEVAADPQTAEGGGKARMVTLQAAGAASKVTVSLSVRVSAPE